MSVSACSDQKPDNIKSERRSSVNGIINVICETRDCGATDGTGRRCHRIIETMKGPHLNLQNRPRSARSTHMEQSTILRQVQPKCMSLPAKCAAPRRRVRTGPSAASLLGALDALWLQQCTTTLLPAAVRCSRTRQAEPRLVMADLVHG